MKKTNRIPPPQPILMFGKKVGYLRLFTIWSSSSIYDRQVIWINKHDIYRLWSGIVPGIMPGIVSSSLFLELCHPVIILLRIPSLFTTYLSGLTSEITHVFWNCDVYIICRHLSLSKFGKRSNIPLSFRQSKGICLIRAEGWKIHLAQS